MSPEGSDPESPEPEVLTAEEREARRRRLAEVFGETLPEQTSDDADEPESRPDGADEWLRRQVPPHHG
ncbi:MAG TPA: hypothetical protein VNQ53_05380 [Nocardioides sp.]|nr:hypothetical protein [Nocardioides sp.]